MATAKGEIDGTVWNDLNGNGVRDWTDLNGNGVFDPGEGDPGLAGWTVFADLPDATHPFGDGIPDNGEITATTAADGSYKLTGLPTGTTYYIREVLQSNWNEEIPLAAADFFVLGISDSIPVTGHQFFQPVWRRHAARGDGDAQSPTTSPRP